MATLFSVYIPQIQSRRDDWSVPLMAGEEGERGREYSALMCERDDGEREGGGLASRIIH
jgi:hypothetical protein